jgi:HPt (histidine-containing phosphotransfer) domain-containing protein
LDREVLLSIRELPNNSERDLASELVEIYLGDTPPRLSGLRKAVAEEDLASIQAIAHSVKSSSANVGARRLSIIAGRLESMGRSGDVSRAPELIMLMETEYRRACRELEDFFSGKKAQRD